ncbi:hypothetical protein FRC12_024629 [Ceratobasidium sp. 428]|nr:hypothetical protein FRC12_024629 [Ceratobasidium sp. 428]
MSTSNKPPSRLATRRVLPSVSPVEPGSLEPGGRKTPPSEPPAGSALTQTPYYTGSAQRTKESSANSHSQSGSRTAKSPSAAATHSRVDNTVVATPDMTPQVEMDRYLEAEMKGAILCDPNFVKNFLTSDPSRVAAVLKKSSQKPAQNKLSKITKERDLYQPICKILNAIREAADNILGRKSTPFKDVSNRPIPSDDRDIAGIKPDLAWFNGKDRHWETVRMPVELKRLPTFLKTGMKQLTRYARAVFAHQLHRRHLYGLVVCETQATFVRFDRSGILYSKPLDVRDQPTEFQQAFAGLMLLNEEEFGYDPAFTTRPNSDGRLEYYVDLPAALLPPEVADDTSPGATADTRTPSTTGTSASAPGTSSPPTTAPGVSTKRFKVMECLCHRKSIRARATIVLRVIEMVQPKPEPAKPEGSQARRSARVTAKAEHNERQAQQAPLVTGWRQYVLKLMWRDPRKVPEGDVLKPLVGTYGIVQYVAHGDMLMGHNCHKPTDRSCEACVDQTPGCSELEEAENMTDLNIAIPEEDEDEKETQYVPVQTDQYSPARTSRTPRIYSFLLVSTIGESLHTAESPRRLLEGVLDAILGYWSLVNRGFLHRDISDGNVLLVNVKQEYSERLWKHPLPAPGKGDPRLAESQVLLQKVLDELDRDPSGTLSDFDLFATHAWISDVLAEDEAESGASDVSGVVTQRGVTKAGQYSSLSQTTILDESARKRIDFRTGTPTFMAVRVLKVKVGNSYAHHFMDDLESFFWLIVWCVAQHMDEGKSIATTQASLVLNQLDRSCLRDIANYKTAVFGECSDDGGAEMEETLRFLENAWAADPGITYTILKLGQHFGSVSRRKILEYTPDEQFPKVLEIVLEGVARCQ